MTTEQAFHVWDDLDSRWHHIRAWDPEHDTITTWCTPTPQRLHRQPVTATPGLPLCRDCTTAHTTHTVAHTQLDAARLRLAELRRTPPRWRP